MITINISSGFGRSHIISKGSQKPEVEVIKVGDFDVIYTYREGIGEMIFSDGEGTKQLIYSVQFSCTYRAIDDMKSDIIDMIKSINK